MHVHILGICGTFMGSLALLARDLGHTVTGSDANIYPPMSTQLERAGVTIEEGYDASHLQPAPDLVIVGNAMKRGIEAVEYMLDEGIPYTSGPQFLSEHVLQNRHVLAVAGTHGKTTTTTMLAWVLHYCGIDTGFLIGGVPLVHSEDEKLTQAFAHSSYLGADKTADGKRGYFVIEADEYDSAFFDKRSKFVHYRPRTAILNNLEFDHADIFKDLDAIQTQFHHMIRMIPSTGQIIMPAHTPSLEATIDKGCWTPIWRTEILDAANPQGTEGCTWKAQLIEEDGSEFLVHYHDAKQGQTVTGKVHWGMSGRHNVENAMVAVAAAFDIGISVEQACDALSQFSGIKRRMELIADLEHNTADSSSKVQIFDDFAHHPTAITTTLDGAKKKLKTAKIWAVIEPRSNTMKLGVHKDNLAASAQLADEVIWYEPAGLEWGLTEVIGNAKDISNKQYVMNDTQKIIDHLLAQMGQANKDDAIIIMSNGGFEGIHQRLLAALKA
ncbi:UDP-N-acetylmuramate:L-alanyl-gamma-D-glutamyl-meso-diaminopimelate ligase [Psychrobacter sanguinis]|uniref:UDP-N-acetylmuramate:L-alanyl-gamma-D-glutamyl- meso-diaminopimelate ligase n=1 Tax=Psychrobacter sanguinis TaxID=861445 RepID=UPI00020C7A6A|nr:UDP-N-acetylmuramate:L-alanyl-gamma-D-glutamyl-meso-diaminopimelate ligase [Psychrobacter sanguinis]EGK13169.1 UDP-N-acetylmuramate:L-alanyl-gamma-D-glutamyl-meso-diaminopimelate ligase (murein peptide ligase) [Psychrobacter sp. 1501(2011)]MCC3309009.1 UDP-N-acetylmuramate:L-alanyl-gamma-D-glutamyl-meso-diaminopimelate ligase [Psychrobacter sanguinis]MCD9150278.1 UDP-N-acetylmuramate:L-alanyl-gamma-D-glutamyl-meso-diaminopimelate ligase [Psychrobacter sanguinis]UEC26297.1 UDP-N-acetylmuramat